MRVCSVAVRGAGAVSGGQLAGGGAGILGHTTAGRSGRWLVAGGLGALKQNGNLAPGPGSKLGHRHHQPRHRHTLW